jgi:glycosyltransferase involved in cell wall biosynthesis
MTRHSFQRDKRGTGTDLRARRNGRVDLAVVLNGFPRLSETFVLQELLELERHGLRLHVVALRDPEETVRQEALGKLRAEVEYLPNVADAAPRIAVRTAHAALLLRRPSTYLDGLADVIASPDFSRTNLRRAVILAHRLVRLGSPPVYVHFAHKPATIARFACLMTGIPYGLSAHAKDIWLTPEPELVRKVRDAAIVLTCTAEGQSHLERLSKGRTAVRLVYHGVDTNRDLRRRADDSHEPVVLTVGRLVEKKGHETLLRAAAVVKERGRTFRLRIAGEGVEWSRLQRLVHELELGDNVAFLGPLSESEVAREYTAADVFALACRELENGDRDGVPNVLLEAMAHGLAIVATSGAGVAEAVADGDSALLAAPSDVEGLASRLERLLVEPMLRERLAKRARERVAERFDRDANLPEVVKALASAALIPGPTALGQEDTAPREEERRGALEAVA